MSQMIGSFGDTLRTELLQLLKDRINHFQAFRDVANLRGQRIADQHRHQRQYKTEKWLQAELVHHFWTKGIKVIPEYSKAKWDLYVRQPNSTVDFRIALKCFADSAQRARSDYFGGSAERTDNTRGVIKDLKAILDLPDGAASFALILPFATEIEDKQRYAYHNEMFQCIEAHQSRSCFDVQEYRIPFAGKADEGIVLLWIRCKR